MNSLLAALLYSDLLDSETDVVIAGKIDCQLDLLYISCIHNIDR